MMRRKLDNKSSYLSSFVTAGLQKPNGGHQSASNPLEADFELQVSPQI